MERPRIMQPSESVLQYFILAKTQGKRNMQGQKQT